MVHIAPMNGTATQRTEGHWPPPKNGAKVRAELMAASYYPVEDDEGPDRVRFTVSLTKEQHADLELVAEIWNELDRALGKERKKWKLNGVIERLAAIGIDGFWQQMGGRPPTREGREEFIAEAVERIRRSEKKR